MNVLVLHGRIVDQSNREFMLFRQIAAHFLLVGSFPKQH